MEWTEMMARRDRIAMLLRPHLGRQQGVERANDIVQALVFGDDDPVGLALRMLARDLEPRAAEVVAFQLGRAWQRPLPREGCQLSYTPAVSHHRPLMAGVSRGAASGATAPRIARRRRKETIIIG